MGRGIALSIPLVVALILAVVIVALLLGVGQLATQVSVEADKITELYDSIALPIEEEKFGSGKLLNVVGDFRPLEMPNTATEAGCSIAKAIRDNYAKNGDANNDRKGTSDEFQDLRSIGSKYYIMDSGVFEINWGQSGPVSSDSLPEAQKKLLEENCKDDSKKSFIHCKNKLDEQCVAAILSGLKVGELPVCSKIPIPGGSYATFGDNNCGSSVLPNQWGTQACKDLCPGADKIAWKAVSKENILDNGMWEDSITADKNIGGGNFVPECAKPPCNPVYRYVLFWNKKDKGRYFEVEILKTPNTTDVGRLSSTDLASKLAKVFKQGSRGSDAGAKYRDLRNSVNVIFEPTDNVSFTAFTNSFIDNVKKERGEKEWEPIFETCVAEDCPNSELKTMDYHQITDDEDKSTERDQFAKCDKKIKEYRKIYIRSTLDPTSDFLENGKKYIVVLNQWKHTTEKRNYFPGCSGLGVQCYICVDDECNYNAKFHRDCLTKDSFVGEGGIGGGYKIRDMTTWKDYSLIVVPVEE